MKIVYLTWGETPRSYGIFGSQVIGQFFETKKMMPGSEFHFISGLPLVHSGLVREKFSFFQELREVRRRLGGIAFSIIPIYALQSLVNPSKRTFGYMHMVSHWHLARKLQAIQPDVVHCRSYHAAWAALKVRLKFKLRYKVMFDGRGLWPEEVALKRGYSEQSADYRFLKEVESWILRESDLSIAVSSPMAEHYAALNAKAVGLVYLSAAVDVLAASPKPERKPGDVVSVGYVGALSDDGWHKPVYLLGLYRKVRQELGNTRLIIVTTSDHAALRKVFAEFPEEEVILTSTKTVDQLAEVLRRFDFAALSYFSPASARERKLSSVVLAAKTVEYLAAGLPMLCNRECGGAAAIVEERNLGITYNPGTLAELTREKLLALLDPALAARASLLSRELFDYRANALRYANYYTTLTA